MMFVQPEKTERYISFHVEISVGIQLRPYNASTRKQIKLRKYVRPAKWQEYYENADPKSISVYDMNTKQTTQFANYSDFSNPGNIVVDPATGDIIIIDQPFSVLNDIYVYGSDGVLKKKLETGYYTTNMRFVTE